MLTVNPSPSHPFPHRRRALHCHPLPHPVPSSRRRSLSHPSPVSPTPSSLAPLDVDGLSEDDDFLPPTLHSAPFALKETSDESSDLLSDSASDEDDDSSSSHSSLSPAASAKAKQLATVVAKRVSLHASHPAAHHTPQASHFAANGVDKAAVVLHRKLKASSRQHRVSSHYYSPLKPLSRPPHSHELLLNSRPHRKAYLQPIASPISPLASSIATPAPLFVGSPVVDAQSFPSAPTPSSSSSRFALLLLLLRRSDGRDKLVKAVYYGSNELRWTLRTLGTLLSRHRWLTSVLTGASTLHPSPISLLGRLGLLGLLVGKRLDAVLGAMGGAMGSARQLLRFGRWVADLDALHCAWKAWRAARASSSPSLQPLLELLGAALGLLIDLLDDVEWLAEQGGGGGGGVAVCGRGVGGVVAGECGHGAAGAGGGGVDGVEGRVGMGGRRRRWGW